MWFEILPGLGVMFTAMTLGMWGTGAVCQAFLKHDAYRDNTDNHKIQHYHRDCRIAGHVLGPYYATTLESIPDEPEVNVFMPK